MIRRCCYARFSEARGAQWLLLLAADRVDVVESRIAALVGGRPYSPWRDRHTGGAIATATQSRFSDLRADSSHVWSDPLAVSVPWLLTGTAMATILLIVGRHRP